VNTHCLSAKELFQKEKIICELPPSINKLHKQDHNNIKIFQFKLCLSYF